MRPTVREETGAVFMLRCAELRLSREDLDEMTMGMANDAEKYDLKGQPGAMREFFGGGGRLGG